MHIINCIWDLNIKYINKAIMAIAIYCWYFSKEALFMFTNDNQNECR